MHYTLTKLVNSAQCILQPYLAMWSVVKGELAH